MAELKALRALARELGIHTHYTDGLGKRITVGPETLLRVAAALGAPVSKVSDAAEAMRALKAQLLPPVIVAWDGVLELAGEVELESGGSAPRDRPLPWGYHRLHVASGDRRETCTVIAAPVAAWHRPGAHRSWGVGTQLAALRSARSRAVGDLRDLESLCDWVRQRGGDLITALPLLPTFNTDSPEPSPYSPVSRLFWSELVLDLGDAHRSTGPVETLDVTRADAEVRAALASQPVPEAAQIDPELARYARFRGAQKRLGRNWRAWPEPARSGTLSDDQVDSEEARFHLVAQTLVRRQMHDLRERLDQKGMRLGLDLAVGVHSDGYDPWSRQQLFGGGMSVGAPPDQGFPSGQDWGFSPVLPAASRREGHRYLAASIAHQAGLAGLLRVDHIMAWTRLYWIPHGLGLHEGTYVSYPADELFAILTLESHRHHCEVVGENLGNVPEEIDAALPRHSIWGMYLAQFQDWALKEPVPPPTARDMALIGTHDTPTFAGWLAGTDIGERVRYGLLPADAEQVVRDERARAAEGIARHLGRPRDDVKGILMELLKWLGGAETPLVVPWLEDFWQEQRGVNLPGTSSSLRPNWQLAMRKLLDDICSDPDIDGLVRLLHHARNP